MPSTPALIRNVFLAEKEVNPMMQDNESLRVRYMVDDVVAVVHFNTTLLGFTLLTNHAPAFEFGSTVVVERASRNSAEHSTCALCWTGPRPMAGSVRRDTANAAEASAICSRCLVTLEMLAAAQFDFPLRLQIETPA
jgi:hypothetical protein